MDMQAFAVAMAGALDGTWTVEPGHHGHRDRYLIGPDGEELHVCYSDWEKTPRLRLSASLPAKLVTIRHRHGNPAPSHEITVSPAKTPETVAAETARRLPLAGTATVPRNCKQVVFAFSVASDGAAKVAAFLATFPHTDQPTQSEPEGKPTDPEMPHFAGDQVSRAVNDGADLVIDEVATHDCDDDLINLVVNAALADSTTPPLTWTRSSPSATTPSPPKSAAGGATGPDHPAHDFNRERTEEA
ncbi:hypothetical protein DI005_22175 [Prauserella sp. PE36]|uniref:hypothetical protein n=1 Tax=Prauserella sp. PE36 TaxID=1504709 RepID=UPI000DE5539B|nr:hypothetical protein [Prauserella sp. PE36]RBM17399.1 hypothetical protein DI005_22175 [Prauserella sp. PE36]